MTRILAMFVTFWLAFPSLAQDAAPADAYLDQVIAAIDAAQPNDTIEASIVAELARQRAAGTLDETWVPLYVILADLRRAATGDPADALPPLAEAEAVMLAAQIAEPLYLDWNRILRALRWADMGRLTEAADLLEPLLPSSEPIYGAEERARLTGLVTKWRAQGNLKTFDKMVGLLETASDAMQRGDLGTASDAARAVLLPLDQVAGNDMLAVAQAYVTLSLVETLLGDYAAAAKLARQGVIYVTDPPWDGAQGEQAAPSTIPPVRGLALQDPDFLTVAISAFQIAATTSNEIGDRGLALRLRIALAQLGQSPGVENAIGVIDRALAANSGDLTLMLASAQAAVALLEPQRDTDPRGYRFAVFELAMVEAMIAEKSGGPVDYDALLALADDGDSAVGGLAAKNLQGMVVMADHAGADAVMLALAERAFRLRRQTASALTVSEQARDQFLRDGRSLTESWLNAAFALTRTRQEASPDADLSLVCSDATRTSFCVMWRYEGSVSNPAR